ncbi:hypothetical protein QQX98_009577 [Neonectria punicea]|uniref:Uncharacterized protein n=1 Tax=Neonectria punicea TaxID=979145 RepID=A0ABR1GSF1_9HYPO
MGSSAEIGSTHPRALERRRSRVNRKRLRLQNPETGNDESDEESESEPEEEEENAEDWYSEDEDASYHPHLVTPASLEWLRDVRCLGFNPLATGMSR